MPRRAMARLNAPGTLHHVTGRGIVHPWAINESAWSVVTDNYLVTETGVSECLHKT